MDKDTEDYLRGLAGESPLSLSGQLGEMHRKRNEARDEKFRKSFESPPKKIHYSSGGGSGGGGSGGIDVPLTDDLADSFNDWVRSPVGKRISWVWKIAIILGLMYAFNSYGSISFWNFAFGAVIGFLIPKILYYLFFFSLAIIETIIRFIFGGIIAISMLLIFLAGSFVIFSGIGFIANFFK